MCRKRRGNREWCREPATTPARLPACLKMPAYHHRPPTTHCHQSPSLHLPERGREEEREEEDAHAHCKQSIYRDIAGIKCLPSFHCRVGRERHNVQFHEEAQIECHRQQPRRVLFPACNAECLSAVACPPASSAQRERITTTNEMSQGGNARITPFSHRALKSQNVQPAWEGPVLPPEALPVTVKM